LQHPVTTEYAEAQRQIGETLYAVQQSGLPAFWFWPNVDAGSDGTSKGIRQFREKFPKSNVHFFRNMTSQDFLQLVCNCKCLVGNSSVGIRECAFLGVPTVNVGTRQSGRDRGQNVVDTNYDWREILAGIRKHVNNGHYAQDCLYGDGKSGQRIANLLSSAPLTIEKRLNY